MHETNRIFEQTPPPHFCLKVVVQKVGGVFSVVVQSLVVGRYGTSESSSVCLANTMGLCSTSSPTDILDTVWTVDISLLDVAHWHSLMLQVSP